MKGGRFRGPRLRRTHVWGIVVLAAAARFLSAGCTPAEDSLREPRHVLVVGIDVSGSFRGAESHADALDFLAHYLYGHLNGLGGLQRPTALFVGSVGGDLPGETKSFHPIHDFRGGGVEEIAADLRRWFPAGDRLTDFNAFFRRVGELVKRQGLVLAPMDVVVLSDGVPDAPAAGRAGAGGGSGGGTGARPAGGGGSARTDGGADDGDGEGDPYAGIDLSPLEYLSRTITVRLLYPEPTVAADWERRVRRRRVRLWTTDRAVMAGWRSQVRAGAPPEEQEALWTWIADNVDFRVRARIF